MSKQISSSDFIAELVANKGHFRGASQIVRGNIGLYADKIDLTLIRVENVTFQEMVTIAGFKKGYVSLGFGSSNFLHGLIIESCGVGKGCIQIAGCQATHINLWSSRLENVLINGVEAERSLDLSGLNLSEALSLTEIKTPKLELMHSSHMGRIRTPLVKTDNLLFAEQFRLAGIPVFMSTEMVKKMLEDRTSREAILA